MQDLGGDDGDSPKGDVDLVLEAAAALTEMAGGPRVNPSASPPSVRAAAHRLLRPESPGNDEPGILMPPKDALCCTPAKRPAGIPLWDGARYGLCCEPVKGLHNSVAWCSLCGVGASLCVTFS